ncbi:MAG: hypothetical protein DRO93_10665 [Candidatus Thorarchaeota archaeon]|nr:MAG: hypothetical protein DRO93_10665 [Candidatus Thorarchaeota archaeon]
MWIIVVSGIELIPYVVVAARDSPAAFSIIVSLVSVVVTVTWNLITYWRTRDEYVPVLNVEWPDTLVDDSRTDGLMVVTLRNDGKRRLVPTTVKISAAFLSEPAECTLDDDFIMPKEETQCRAEVKLPPPGSHEFEINVIDRTGVSWTRRHRFRMPDWDEIGLSIHAPPE